MAFLLCKDAQDRDRTQHCISSQEKQQLEAMEAAKLTLKEAAAFGNKAGLRKVLFSTLWLMMNCPPDLGSEFCC